MNPMGLLGILTHFANLLLPALGVGVAAGTLAKILWRGRLRAARWQRLVAWPTWGALIATMLSLAGSAHDGQILGYALLVLSTALGLTWAGGRTLMK